jgi:hypothetical protein
VIGGYTLRAFDESHRERRDSPPDPQFAGLQEPDTGGDAHAGLAEEVRGQVRDACQSVRRAWVTYSAAMRDVDA